MSEGGSCTSMIVFVLCCTMGVLCVLHSVLAFLLVEFSQQFNVHCFESILRDI